MTRDTHALPAPPDDGLLVAPQEGHQLGVDLPQPCEATAELAVVAQQTARPRHLAGIEVCEGAPAGAAAGEHVIRSVPSAGPAPARGLPAQAVTRKERPLELLPLPQEQAHERAAVGLAEVVRAAYPDPKKDDPRLVAVDLVPRGRFKRPVSLDEIKSLALFNESPLVRQGRLSVVPLTAAQWKALIARGAA